MGFSNLDIEMGTMNMRSKSSCM